jgi:hypothetical protein
VAGGFRVYPGDDYPACWPDLSREFRRGKRCHDCGTDRELQTHHRNRKPNDCTRGNLRVLCRPCHQREHRTRFPDRPQGERLTMAARSTARRRPASRGKRAPLLSPREHCYVRGIATLASGLGVGICAVGSPGDAGAAVHGWLTHSLGAGALLAAAGLGVIGVELIRSHEPRAAWSTVWGCLLGVWGSVGLLGLALPGWAGWLGRGAAGMFSDHISWLALLPLGGLVAIGWMLARDPLRAMRGVIRDPRAGLLGLQERVSAITAHGAWQWLARWLRRTDGNRGKDASGQPRRRGPQDLPWLSGPPDMPWLSGPMHEDDDTPATGRSPDGDTGLLPLEDEPGPETGIILLPSVAVAEAPARSIGRLGPDRLPSIDLLDTASHDTGLTRAKLQEIAEKIEACLEACKAPAKVVEFSTGPAVTLYTLQPTPGVRVTKYRSAASDLALTLGAAVRVQAPIPGQAAIGIEVPNEGRQVVPLRSVVQAPEFRRIATRSHVAVALGADTSGQPVVGDIASMPHLLIGGTTNSGKSKLIDAILASILMQATPSQCRILLIDPKRVGLSRYNGTLRPESEHVLPHLLRSVVTDPEEAVTALRSLWVETDRRYQMLAARGVEDFGDWHAAGHERMPRIVAVIDELAALMQLAPEVEETICLIAAMGRAAGVHLVVATQSPRADVITGAIKANLPSVIALKMKSGTESRISLDAMGAEKLLGAGDMIFHPMDADSRRLQGTWVDKGEVMRLVAHWWAQAG